MDVRRHQPRWALDRLRPPGPHLQDPEWTPDGRQIAVTRKLKGPVGFHRTTDVIAVFPAEGGPPTDLVILGASGATGPARSGFWEGADRAQSPSFTADGRTLFFGSAIFTGEERRIRRLDLATGTIDDITRTEVRADDYWDLRR